MTGYREEEPQGFLTSDAWAKIVDEQWQAASWVPSRTTFYWRLVGTDIQVRISPPTEGDDATWDVQEAPTGLLTIHLAGAPDEDDETADPLLEPIETPGSTFIRQADWDEETQTWKTPEGGSLQPGETFTYENGVVTHTLHGVPIEERP